MKLVKYCDIEILYHPGKANVIAVTLCRKTIHLSTLIMILKELQEDIQRVEIEVIV